MGFNSGFKGLNTLIDKKEGRSPVYIDSWFYHRHPFLPNLAATFKNKSFLALFLFLPTDTVKTDGLSRSRLFQ